MDFHKWCEVASPGLVQHYLVWMSDKDDPGVKVTMKKDPKSEEAAEEWENEFDGGGDATAIDPKALENLRSADAQAASSVEDVPKESAKTSEPEVSASSLLETDTGDAEAENTDFDENSVTRMDPKAMGDMAAAEDSIGKEACPNCGVMVASGYPKCPRCKHSLVVAKSSKKSAGGTSVVGRTVPWAIVFIAAVLTAIIVYLSERDPVLESSQDEASEVNGEEDLERNLDRDEGDVDEGDVDEADVDEADVGEADVDEADVDEADVGEADVEGDVGETDVEPEAEEAEGEAEIE
jgi:hypothetical protein